MNILEKKNNIIIGEKQSNNYGIFLRMHLVKGQDIKAYEEIMSKIIKKWKYKYNMQEYAACLECSSEGYMHIHMYINQFMPIKEIEIEWNALAKIKEEGSVHMIKVVDKEHKLNIFKYIWKAPLRTWICQEYKNKYGWKTGKMADNERPNEEKIYFSSNEKKYMEKKENQIGSEEQGDFIKQGKKRDNQIPEKKKDEIGSEEQGDFIGTKKVVPNIGDRASWEIFNSQKDLEKEMMIKTISSINRKMSSNYKNYLIVLKEVSKELENYIDETQLKKKSYKKILLLNLGYIGLQIEKLPETTYMHFKIGDKLFKYYKAYNVFLKKFIEKYYNQIGFKSDDSNKIKIQKIFKFLLESEEYIDYKEQVVNIGMKMYSVLKLKIFEKNENQILVLKKNISEKLKGVLKLELVKKIKYKIPFIEKPIEWGPNLEDYGGWHIKELRKSLVKENINSGNKLDINHKEVYMAINKLQGVEYQVNIEFLNFVLKNKDMIYEVLLKDYELDSNAYKTVKEQYDITLNLAEYMSNYEKFYFTYEMDYRGRLHIVQEYFNYQGNLLARSLIRWANAKPCNNRLLNIALTSLYKGMIGSSNWEMSVFYGNKFWRLKLEDWHIYFKKAKEPILWLALFHEIKINPVYFESKYIIWFDATCSGSQLISLLLNDTSFMEHLNMLDGEKVNDYYTYIYDLYGGFSNIKEEDARKIVKKIVMTINYGLTKLGCHRYFKQLLKKYHYCNNKKDYKDRWESEVDKFYLFLCSLPFVKGLEPLQKIWDQFCDKGIVYSGFKIGYEGFNKENYSFLMKTFIYKKYYKNLSVYNKSSKMKEKGYKYLWHHKKLNKREQKRKIKANLIHMLDAVWNLYVCKLFEKDIACIHDCHGIHSCDFELYFEKVREVLINIFYNSDQYYYLLVSMLKDYLKQTNDHKFYDIMLNDIECYKTGLMDKIYWYKIRKSKYLFIPK